MEKPVGLYSHPQLQVYSERLFAIKPHDVVHRWLLPYTKSAQRRRGGHVLSEQSYAILLEDLINVII